MILLQHGYRSTKGPKRLPPLLPGARQRQAAHVRGFARLFRRGTALCRSGRRLQLLAWILSSPVPSLPPRRGPRLLRLLTPWASLPTQEVRRSRSDRAPAQAEPLGLRNQRRAERATVSSQPHRCTGGPPTRGICSTPAAVRPRTPRRPPPHYRSGCRRPPDVPGSTVVYHLLRRSLLVRSRFGVSACMWRRWFQPRICPDRR